jgi:hypothetical protein
MIEIQVFGENQFPNELRKPRVIASIEEGLLDVEGNPNPESSLRSRKVSLTLKATQPSLPIMLNASKKARAGMSPNPSAATDIKQSNDQDFRSSRSPSAREQKSIKPRDALLLQLFADHPVSRAEVEYPQLVESLPGLGDRVAQNVHDSRWRLALQAFVDNLLIQPGNLEDTVIVMQPDLFPGRPVK